MPASTEEGDLGRAGGFRPVADDAGGDGQCIDHGVDHRLVVAAAQIGDPGGLRLPLR